MKIILMILASVFTSVLVLISSPALAVDINDEFCDSGQPGYGTAYCNEVAAADSDNKSATDNVLVGPDGMITKIVEVISYISGSLAVIMIIIAGFRLILSNGNSESVSGARSTILYAVIGLIVAVSAQLIVIFVLERL